MRYGKPAKVIKPLRFIKEKCAKVTLKNGESVTEYDPAYHEAKYWASKGQGAAVQKIAMQIACN